MSGSGGAPERRRTSLFRLLIVLAIAGVAFLFGARYAFAYVSDVVADWRMDSTSTWFAPYVDVTLTPIVNFEDQAAQPSYDVVLGFVVADPLEPCLPSWGAYYSLDAAARALDFDRRIVRFRERGGDAFVSFGGAINNELATVCDEIDELVAAYQTVIVRYDLNLIDFDLEGAALADQVANNRRGTH